MSKSKGCHMKAPFRRRAFTCAIAVALVTAMAIPIGAFADTGSSWRFGEGLFGTAAEPSREIDGCFPLGA